MPLVLAGATSGQATLQATDAATVTLTLPASTGTLVVTGGAQTIEFADGSAAAPSITNSGDTNTGIFFPAADTIAFSEGGTESMRIDGSGNFFVNKTAYSDTSGNGFGVFPNSGIPQVSCVGAGNSTQKSFTVYSSTDSAYKFYVDYAGNGYYANNLLVGATATSRTGQSRIRSAGTQSSLLVECSGATVASGVLEVAASAAPSNTSNYLIIGTTSAVDKFYVYSNGNVVNANNSYGSLSDQSIKENVVDATPKLDKINSVRVVNYNLIGDEQKQIGVIAQELETVFPSLVDTDGKSGLKQVKYSVFVPMLIKAFQELNAKVDAQAARIAALEGAA